MAIVHASIAPATATGVAQLTVTITNNAPAEGSARTTSRAAARTASPPGSARTVGYLYLPEGFELVMPLN